MEKESPFANRKCVIRFIEQKTLTFVDELRTKENIIPIIKYIENLGKEAESRGQMTEEVLLSLMVSYFSSNEVYKDFELKTFTMDTMDFGDYLVDIFDFYLDKK